MASKESLMVRQMLQNWVQSRAGKTMTIEELRQELRQVMEELTKMSPMDPEVQVEKININGIPGEWLVPPNAVDDRVILYLHGGAYCAGSCNTHRHLVARIARAAAARTLLVEYRLAPEHQFPAAIEDAVAAYRWLVSTGFNPQQIVIGGDSAGGGLTMATLLTLRDEGDPLPAAAVLISPWTDMEGTGESMETRAEFDPWLNPDDSRATARVYIGDLNPRHPLVSPIYADLQGLPPMLVHVGRDEILLDDSTRLVERARNAGVDVTFKIWDDMWHVFHGFAPNLPEALQAIDEIGEYIKKKLG